MRFFFLENNVFFCFQTEKNALLLVLPHLLNKNGDALIERYIYLYSDDWWAMSGLVQPLLFR